MIRISVLGAANIAVRSIIPLLTPANGFELVGIGYRESSQTKAQTVAQQFGCTAIPLGAILDDVPWPVLKQDMMTDLEFLPTTDETKMSV